MAKAKRGLPEGFGLEIAEEEPVKLGDYLDETAPRPHEESRADKVVEMPPSARPAPEQRRAPAPPPRQTRPAPRRERPISSQINMTAETKARLEALVARVRDYSAERNPRGSDIVCALIDAAHDALTELEFSAVPKRGQWGKPTAKAYRDRLAASLAKGIASDYAQKQ